MFFYEIVMTLAANLNFIQKLKLDEHVKNENGWQEKKTIPITSMKLERKITKVTGLICRI